MHTADSSAELDVEYAHMLNWAALAGAAVLATWGMRRRALPGLCCTLAATPLAYRGLTGRWPTLLSSLVESRDDTRTALSGERGLHVRESIRLERPLGEVYRFWRDLQNLPRFMSHLVEVKETGDRRSHWVARGPAGVSVAWDAEIVNEVENQVIGWRSLPGSDVVTAGSVNFDAVRGGQSTQLSVHLQYEPPAGRMGALVSALFGREPSQTIREDLRRLKQLLEAGELAQAVASYETGGSR